MTKKSEEQILFPEVKVGNITVKPWSFGILFDISDLLDEVITRVEEKKIGDIISDEGFLSYINMVKLFSIASKPMLKIIEITLDKEEEEIRKLSMEDGIKISIIIAKQNWEIISKNLLNLLPKVEALKEEEETK